MNLYYIILIFLKKIDEENEKIYPKIKAKINELFMREKWKIVEIDTGNNCNNLWYQYNYKFTKECIKCGVKVE